MVDTSFFNLEHELFEARNYLMKISDDGNNFYDQLSTLLERILTERPDNAADLVESYITDGRISLTQPHNVTDLSKQNEFANLKLKLFEKKDDDNTIEDDKNKEDFEASLPNCMQHAFYFEQGSVGIGREETYHIFLSLKELALNFPLASVRFWGKILGLQANYYIAESEFREGEGEDEESEEEVAEENDEEKIGDGPREEETIPKKLWKPVPPVPREAHRSGSNKKVYFVCNEPGEQWIKLPHVTPAEIVAARRIVKLFTGRLDTIISSYPPFPGNEAQLLRAQISRISACTQISPAGFYIFDNNDEEENEEDELEEAHNSYIINDEFEGLSISELTDPSMMSWVHHTQYLLPQGRCSWYNPYQKQENDIEEDEEEESGAEIFNPETGPTLLSSVADDSNVGEHRAWSVHVSSKALPEYAVAVAHSNLWPGAIAVAKGRFFENFYVGWGQKYLEKCYNPSVPPMALQEYSVSAEIAEQDDPSAEEEKAFKAREEAAAAKNETDNEEEENNED